MDSRMLYGAAYSGFPPLYDREYERSPALDLPFRAEDFHGAAWP